MIISEGDLNMPIESHVESLKLQHKQLESQLDQMMADLSVDDSELAAIKRRKLALKDKIQALSN